jgi:DNA mismatch repair protein MutS
LVTTYIKPFQLNANLVAIRLFVLLAQLAQENKYVCPDLDESFDLEIKMGDTCYRKQLPVGVPILLRCF